MLFEGLKAQVDTPEYTDQLDTVFIRSTRIQTELQRLPASATNVELSKRQGILSHTDLSEALSEVPGLFALNGQNFAQDLRLSIRGFGSRSAFGIRGVKLIVDGIPETTPDGQGQLDNIAVADINRIEILQGTHGAAYGNASGGILNMSTFAIDQNGGAASLRFGSFGQQEYRLKVTGTSDRTSYGISTTHQRSDGYRDHSSLVQTNILAKLQHEWNRSSLVAQVSYLASPKAQDPGGVTLEQATDAPTTARDRNISFNAGEEINHWKSSLRYQAELNNNWSFNSTLFLSGRAFDGRLPFGNGGAIDLNRSYGGWLNNVQKKMVGATFVNDLIVGIDVLRQRDDRKRFVNNDGERGDMTLSQIENFNNLGIYITDQFTTDKTTVNAGLRYDINGISIDDIFSNGMASGERDVTALTYNLGVSQALSDQQAIYATLSTSFETPTLSELSANPTGLGGFNEDLGPMKANTFELGFRHQSKVFAFSGALFVVQSTDELLPFEIADFPGRSFFQNIGKTKRNGLETSILYSGVESIVLQTAYTYSDFQFEDFVLSGTDLSGKALPGIPKHALSSSVTYSDGPLSLRLSSQYYSSISVRNDQTTSVAPYHLMNVRAGYDLKVGGSKMNFFFGVNNLLDTYYFNNLRLNAFGSRHYEVGSGRGFVLGVGFEW